MNTLILQPTDVLFFRDGRPMDGSLTGNGAAWPLPTVTNSALHAALHRSQIAQVHNHRRARSSHRPQDAERDRKFGSLLTAGPFPVHTEADTQTWYFPRPLDADALESTHPTSLPIPATKDTHSSLPSPLRSPVANTLSPSKDTPHPWWNKMAWVQYLGNDIPDHSEKISFKNDTAFSSIEHQIGIGIDPETNTQDKERFYSAHYLRLKSDWNLGILASAIDKINQDKTNTRDLINDLFKDENHIIAGGQQRICSVKLDNTTAIPLPTGKSSFNPTSDEKYLIKWTLLTPTIYPRLEGKHQHPGAWLPTWVNTDGYVQLLNGPGKNAAKRKGLTAGTQINAKLISAITGKPIPVTGYALGYGIDEDLDSTSIHPEAKPTRLAIPAGSVYYFECPTAKDATDLANALNWHGTSSGSEIQNRRSTTFGEKGFGLGVCSSWQYHNGKRPELI